MEIKKYKLLKNLPDVKAGAIIQCGDYSYDGFQTWNNVYFISNTNYTFSKHQLENNPDWFTPYLFTTEDNVDVFKNDWFYALYPNNKIEKIRFSFFTEKDNSYKYFSTKEAAEQYLESLKPKFKVGDIVINKENNYILKIVAIVEDVVHGVYDDNSLCISSIKNLKPTEQNKIIQYYQKQGWVKGARFKYKQSIYTFNYIYSNNNWDCEWLLVSYKENTGYLGLCLKDCELIKEPNYPKDLEELNCEKDDNLLNCIKNLIDLYGKEKFKQKWDL